MPGICPLTRTRMKLGLSLPFFIGDVQSNNGSSLLPSCSLSKKVALTPTPASVFSEHQFYLPLVGVALALASVFAEPQAVTA